MSLELFNAVSIEVLLDEQNQPWFKRAHVGKFLEIKHIETSLDGLDSGEIKSRSAFGSTPRSTGGWSRPKGEQNKTSVYGVMHVIVNSRKSKGKALKEWVLKDVVPRGFNKMIEEKNMQLALLNDDLTESEKHSLTETSRYQVSLKFT